MIEQFFTYKSYKRNGFDLGFTYEGITTVADLPGIPKGSTFMFANVDYDDGELAFFSADSAESLVAEFKLSLVVEAHGVLPAEG